MDSRETGAYVSPPDYRDLIARAAAVTVAPIDMLPSSMHTNVGPVLDQNKIPACVSHSAAQLMMRYWFAKTGKWIRFSPRFLDTLVKRFDGLDRGYDGTWPRMVLKLARDYGCATEDVLPNETANMQTLGYRNDSLLTPAVMANAAQYKIPGFISVGTDPVSTKNAIYLYGAVSSLFSIGNEFWLPSWSPKDIDPIRTPHTVESGHELTPCGWTENGLMIGRNEWSTDWDINGEFHYDAKAWEPFIHEQWAIAEIPQDVAAFLKQLPAAKDFHYAWTKNMTRGEKNEDIAMAQVAYMMLGHLKPISPDEFGYFGSKTTAANFAFQSSHGISPSPSNIGSLTRRALNYQFA